MYFMDRKAPRRYPAVEWTTPLGLPVEPEVYCKRTAEGGERREDSGRTPKAGAVMRSRDKTRIIRGDSHKG
jgi:hypothetical protein